MGNTLGEAGQGGKEAGGAWVVRRVKGDVWVSSGEERGEEEADQEPPVYLMVQRALRKYRLLCSGVEDRRNPT